jgi:hypothetical protein
MHRRDFIRLTAGSAIAASSEYPEFATLPSSRPGGILANKTNKEVLLRLKKTPQSQSTVDGSLSQ